MLEKLTEKGELRMNTRSKVICLIGVLFLVLSIAWRVYGVNVEAKEFQPAEIQASGQTGPDESATIPDLLREEYENWMEKAEGSAGAGYSARMNSYLTKAMWTIEDANIPEDIKAFMLKDSLERTENIRLNGYENDASDAELNALTNAYSGYEILMKSSLEKFKFYSLKAGMEPNGKAKKIEEILAESLAERKKLLGD